MINNMKNKVNGITLVALVITIIVLLILAGISIKYILGDNGIINRSETAKLEYEQSKEEEKKGLDELYSSIMIATNGNSQVTISIEDLKTLINTQVEEKVKTMGVGTTPVGTIINQMSTTPPTGYLLCDGTVYNIADYKILADHIKEQFGKYDYWGGDGETTFAVPNLQGQFLRGYSSNEQQSATTGIETAEVGKNQEATSIPVGIMTSNNGNLYLPNHSTEQIFSKNYDLKSTPQTRTRLFLPNTTESNLYTDRIGIITTRPTNTSVLYCIKY